MRYISLIVLLAFPLLASGKDFLEVEESRILRAVELSVGMEKEASEEISRIIEEAPESPVGYLLRSTRLYWDYKYSDRLNNDFRIRFEEAAKVSYKKSKSYYKSEESESALYALAMSELNLARFYIDERRWLSAFFKANAGLKKVRKVLKRNPEFHDAKLSLGLANCYLGKAPGYLKPFAVLMRFPGDMEVGLEQLQDVKSEGLFSSYESSYYWGLIQWELNGELEMARQEFETLSERFPRNIKYQQLAASTEENSKRADQAYDRYLRILDLPHVGDYQSIQVRVLLRLSQISIDRDNYEDALSFARKAVPICRAHGDLNPVREWCYLLQGVALFRQNHFEGALEALELVDQDENPKAYSIARDLAKEIRENLNTRA